MTEPTKLMPCPFCGGAASLHNDTDSPCWFVGCSNSACPIEPCHYADTEAEAIATWNHRPPQPTQAQAGAVPRPVTAAEHEVLMAAARDNMTFVAKGRLVESPEEQAADSGLEDAARLDFLIEQRSGLMEPTFWGFFHTTNIYESAPALISLHRTKAGAWKAMHKAQWDAWVAYQNHQVRRLEMDGARYRERGWKVYAHELSLVKPVTLKD